MNPDWPFLLPMGMLVLSREAKELCLESWALAARALFHSALISMEARYSVWGGKRSERLAKKQSGEDHNVFFPSCVCVYLLGVGAGVQARHQVEDVAERHWVQVFDEWGEEVVDVTATVFQLKHQTRSRINYFIFEQKRDVFVLKSEVWDLNIWINVCSNITFVTASDGTWASWHQKNTEIMHVDFLFMWILEQD